MYVTELDSFIRKFHQLWRAGFTAHLDIDAHAGQAWVGIRAQLGPAPGPAHQEVHHHHFRSPRRGPAYQRRQGRRRQAAQAAADTGLSPSGSQVSEKNSTEDIPAAEASNQHDEMVEEVETGNTDNLAEQADEVQPKLSCDFCSFTSNWENGVKIHIARKHKTIVQLDGSNKLEEDDYKYCATSHYWKEGQIGTGYQTYLDALDIVEESDLSEDTKHVEKAKVLEARKEAFGSRFKFYPPWSRD